MKLDDAAIRTAREHLLGPGSDGMIRFMAHQSVPRWGAPFAGDVSGTARSAGWIDAGDRRTETGVLVSDSCREYLFWVERDRRLPFDGALPEPAETLFAGKYVVEVGSGMGPNLMSIGARAGRLCGIEPVEAYAQLGAIFCEREGITPPDMRPGAAEALPFGDDEVDVLLCVSAYQYFDIHPALAEFARVLRPGGVLIIVGGALSTYARRTGLRVLRNPRAGKAFGITLLNTLWYTAFGRRIILSRSRFTTSRPIYPSRRAMLRWMSSKGFEAIAPPQQVGPETCYCMRRT